MKTVDEKEKEKNIPATLTIHIFNMKNYFLHSLNFPAKQSTTGSKIICEHDLDAVMGRYQQKLVATYLETALRFLKKKKKKKDNLPLSF